jgi:hypothetical protein
MTEAIDRRTTPARSDLAAEHLRGRVAAERYAAGQARQVGVPVVALSFSPDANARLESQILLGEDFTVYEEQDGWAWGQAALDGYVGYLPAAALVRPVPPTHVVSGLATYLYPAADLKRRPLGRLGFGARFAVTGECNGFLELAAGGFVFTKHASALDQPDPGFVATAQLFLGVPYLWGGRSADGVDCSGLLQLVLQRAGIAAPRDSDQQAATLGQALPPPWDFARLHAGDLVFFPGHAGIALGDGRFLHANAFDMRVSIHALADVLARAEAAGQPANAIRRL